MMMGLKQLTFLSECCLFGLATQNQTYFPKDSQFQMKRQIVTTMYNKRSYRETL